MKKVFMILVLMFITLTTSLEASNGTVLNREETSKNNIKISLDQQLGYVTSYNVSLKLEGKDVTYNKITWDSNLKSEDYKSCTYNSSNKTLEIYVVSKSNSNLVNPNGVINIGTITVNSTKNNSEYNIILNKDKTESVVLMKNSYDKEAPSSVANNNTSKFIATNNDSENNGNNSQSGSNNSNSTSNNNNSNNTNNNPNSNPNNNGTNNNSNSASNTTNSNSASSDDEIKNNDENIETPSNDDNVVSNIPTEPEENIGDITTKEKGTLNFFVVLILAIIAVIVIVVVIYITMRIQNNNKY